MAWKLGILLRHIFQWTARGDRGGELCSWMYVSLPWMNAFCFVINVFPYLLLTCSTTLKKYTVVQIYSVIIQLAFQFICLWRLKKTQHKKNSLIVGGTHWTKCQMEWDATEGTSKHNMGWRRINRTYQLQRGNWSVRGRRNQKKKNV